MASSGFMGRLREGLDKTRGSLIAGVKKAFTGTSLSDSVYEQLEQVLIEADVGVETTFQIVEKMRRVAREKGLDSPDELYEELKRELVEQLRPGDHRLNWNAAQPPHVTLVVGVNGSGKTTTVGKLTAMLMAGGRRVIIGAADTFRAAASEQLTVWAERSGAEIVKLGEGADPASVAYDATDAAAARNADNVLIDTAGRLHTKVNLMEELRKIQRVVSKRLPDAPHQVLLVLDATTGQNGLQQARVFTEALAVTGIVLTKLDGTAKGGVVIAIQKELGIPIKLIGVGEGVEDLQPFVPEEFVEALFS